MKIKGVIEDLKFKKKKKTKIKTNDHTNSKKKKKNLSRTFSGFVVWWVQFIFG